VAHPDGSRDSSASSRDLRIRLFGAIHPAGPAEHRLPLCV